MDSLSGHWSFDSLLPLDDSGNGWHLHPAGRPGPARVGASLYINKGHEIRTLESRQGGDELTLALWVYLLDAPSGAYRHLVSSGELRLLMNVADNGISVHDGSGVVLMSQAHLLPRRWTHLSVSLSARTGQLRLLVNGVFDGSALWTNAFAFNKPIQVQLGDVAVADEHVPAAEAYIDDVWLFARALPAAEVSALLSPHTYDDPDDLRLGCASCGYDAAVEACPPLYTLCDAEQVESHGVIRRCRRQGWLTRDRSEGVWVRRKDSQASPAGEPKLGVCCYAGERYS